MLPVRILVEQVTLLHGLSQTIMEMSTMHERCASFLSRFAPMGDGMSAARFVNKYSDLIETPELEG